ncbi:hypothetical protein BDV3_000905 [Batrachochytrium dendrobatidis]|uniref:Uncharacterized protein n=1 Tax=Batrachochytrium dendrobatidis (strain JEL423) TaxID=403673 RepID=A0A177W6V9_BATDL|nr:hypothetical protein O5D80_000636 [Batrachochytrium dendrobatidis]KAK5672191.1 hypothetical protein QVD99_001994 [Batrachochytrium dendrobatidis]OAJ35817.1 hypothetical protein BDEG_20051 [Batrachochytrium dendrobatidis JEL423]
MPGIEYGSGSPAADNIWIASGDGRVEDVEYFLKSGGFGGAPMDANAKDSSGYTSLHAAASYNHLDLMRMLVKEYGADPNVVDHDGYTPLHVIETADAGRVLIELGADPTKRNHSGQLPIETAFTECWTDVVDYLQEFTPDFEKREESSDNENENEAEQPDLDESSDNEDEDEANQLDLNGLPEEVLQRLTAHLEQFNQRN